MRPIQRLNLGQQSTRDFASFPNRFEIGCVMCECGCLFREMVFSHEYVEFYSLVLNYMNHKGVMSSQQGTVATCRIYSSMYSYKTCCEHTVTWHVLEQDFSIPRTPIYLYTLSLTTSWFSTLTVAIQFTTACCCLPTPNCCTVAKVRHLPQAKFRREHSIVRAMHHGPTHLLLTLPLSRLARSTGE